MPQPALTLCAYDRPGNLGGPIGWAGDLATYLVSRGYHVHVLVLCYGGAQASALATRCETAGAVVSVLDTSENSTLEDEAEWILKTWSSYPTPVFIANLVVPAMYAARWLKKAGATTVVVFHSSPSADPFHAAVLSQFVAGDRDWKIDIAVVVSEYIAAEVRSAASEATIWRIPCGTRSTELRASPPDPELRIAYLGRFVQKAKRIHELTEALLEVCKTENVVATLYGDGPELNWVLDRLAGQEKVIYGGVIPQTQIFETLVKHHVILLLSDFEGLPISLLEGMACGLVPVCLDEPSGARELIASSENGFIVPDRGPSLRTVIYRLRDPEVWSPLSVSARTSYNRG